MANDLLLLQNPVAYKRRLSLTENEPSAENVQASAEKCNAAFESLESIILIRL